MQKTSKHVDMKTLLLKPLRRLYSFSNSDSSRFGRKWHMASNKPYSSDLISRALLSNKPTMIARLGSAELLCMTNYLGVKYPNKYKSIKDYITNQTPPWWWNRSTIIQMKNCAGFFPAQIDKIEQFCELMIEELPNVDVLGSWIKQESFFLEELSNAKSDAGRFGSVFHA